MFTELLIAKKWKQHKNPFIDVQVSGLTIWWSVAVQQKRERENIDMC